MRNNASLREPLASVRSHDTRIRTKLVSVVSAIRHFCPSQCVPPTPDRPHPSMTAPLQLAEVQSGEAWPLQPGTTLLAGRSREADIILVDPACSRQQFEVAVETDDVTLVPLSDSVPTFCDDVRVTALVELRVGMKIRVGQTTLVVQPLGATVISEPPAEPSSDRPVPAQQTNPAAAPEKPPADSRGPMTQAIPVGLPDEINTGGTPAERIDAVAEAARLSSIRITNDATIGRDKECEIQLDHIQVSRQHARIQKRGERAILRDLNSANGTYVDGQRIGVPVTLNPGSRVGIGPFLLSWDGDALVPTTRTNNLQLEGRRLTRRVRNRSGSGTLTILDSVSVVIRPHEFVVLLGPTGSGKSTLLAALSARTPANSGQVLINQADLYEEFESLKRDIAVVPQHDILHDELTLDEALTYTAKLRLPEDTSANEVDGQIAALAERVGLTRARQTKLGSMSGGQRRRASLANELVASPSLLFLDEVTSGLDEHTDRQMMHLFRGIAESGKTVVCVTHTLANIDECCHLVVLLTVGGKLAFVGSPAEALDYFKIKRLGHIYEILADADRADELQQQFTKSDYYARYVRSRMSPGAIPEDRNNELHEHQFWRTQLATMQHQLPLLLGRYSKVFSADKRSLAGLVLQVLIVAVILFLVFGNVAPTTGADSQELFRNVSECCNVLFVLAVSCFWFGCNNAAREIVKERPIYTRELLVNLSPGSYYISKFALQFSVAAAQSVLLLGLVDSWCSLPGELVQQSAALAAAAAAGVAVGLFLSSVSTTQEVALTLVPLVLIPQIILSDVFVQLEGIPRWLGRTFVSNYWAYGMLRGTLTDELIEQLNPPLSVPLRRIPGLLALICQTVVLGGLSILVLHIRDRVMSCSNKTLEQAMSELPIVGKWLAKAFQLVRPGRRTESSPE